MDPIQLELFPVANADSRADRGSDEWITGMLPDRSGVGAYLIMIREATDPKPPRKAELHSERDKTPHLTLRSQSVEQWRSRFQEAMSDGKARTFNAMCVTIAGLTADICGGETPEEAIWSLVEDGLIEFTVQAPVLFRQFNPHKDKP